VTGVDFAFDGVKPAYPAGLTRIKFVNGGKEVHEMVILRRKPGVRQSFAQLLKLPTSRLATRV
jgi:hypothetical protein